MSKSLLVIAIFLAIIIVVLSFQIILSKKTSTKEVTWGGISWSGIYSMYGPIANRSKVLVMHPVSMETPAVVFTEVKVPVDRPILSIEFSNLAGKGFPRDLWKSPCTYCDSAVRVYVFTTSNAPTMKEAIIKDKFVVKNSEEWVEKKYDLSRVAGKKVFIAIFSVAGGSESWNGEWLGIGNVKFVAS